MIRQEGSPGYERLVIPACSISPQRAVTLLLALLALLLDAALIVGVLGAPGFITMVNALIFLATIPVTMLVLALLSESTRILAGRESLAWEDVFLVHEIALPWVTTTRTRSLSRVEGLQIARVSRFHPLDVAFFGKRYLAIRTRDDVVRVAVGLSGADLDRLAMLANRLLTNARMRIGVRDQA
ncbi:MAG: hypothetical protein FJX76_08520 [Armatimonadetes bacterium]|nr:hypothetical protein [Armatimonadota bacterium]